MSRIILVRHGETKLNVGDECIRGWRNVPLDEHGRDEAKRLAKDVAKYGKPVLLLSSDLDRAQDTAKEIAKETKTTVTPVKGLRPWDVGTYTGKSVKEVNPELKALIRAPAKKAPQGESFADFVDRFMDQVYRFTHIALVAPEHPVVVVTHSRNLRVFLTWMENGPSSIFTQPPSRWFDKDEDPVPPGGTLEILWKRGHWTAGEAKNG